MSSFDDNAGKAEQNVSNLASTDSGEADSFGSNQYADFGSPLIESRQFAQASAKEMSDKRPTSDASISSAVSSFPEYEFNNKENGQEISVRSSADGQLIFETKDAEEKSRMVLGKGRQIQEISGSDPSEFEGFTRFDNTGRMIRDEVKFPNGASIVGDYKEGKLISQNIQDKDGNKILLEFKDGFVYKNGKIQKENFSIEFTGTIKTDYKIDASGKLISTIYSSPKSTDIAEFKDSRIVRSESTSTKTGEKAEMLFDKEGSIIVARTVQKDSTETAIFKFQKGKLVSGLEEIDLLGPEIKKLEKKLEKKQ